jgi:glycosyltransferase involved in cell wall biosynthesis
LPGGLLLSTRRCRVLHVIASSRGGGAEIVRGIVRELPGERFESTVAMPDDGGHLGPIDFERAGGSCLVFDIASGLPLRELYRLRRLVRRQHWDIVHCHGARAGLWGRLAALGQGRPSVVFGVHGLSIVHYTGLKRALLLRLERLLQRMTDATVCDSEAEREDVVRYGIASRERAFTARSGVDIAKLDRQKWDRSAARKRLSLDSEHPVIVTVCRLNKPRDFDTLLAAMQTVVRDLPTARLLIAGGGPLEERIDERIGELGLEYNVRRLGWLRDVGQVLAAADVFVLATRGWEGLALAPLEAMVARLPVVISDVGGNREAVVEGETGLVVPPCRPDLLAHALLQILANPARARRMGESGRRRALEHFSAKRMALDTAMVYSRVNPAC